ncbi:MAG: discoidin domain-containing protein [Lentisphaerota bacterium]
MKVNTPPCRKSVIPIIAGLMLLSSSGYCKSNININNITYNISLEDSDIKNKVISIRNISSHPFGFVLGFNDMLFPDKESLLSFIKNASISTELNPVYFEAQAARVRLDLLKEQAKKYQEDIRIANTKAETDKLNDLLKTSSNNIQYCENLIKQKDIKSKETYESSNAPAPYKNNILKNFNQNYFRAFFFVMNHLFHFPELSSRFDEYSWLASPMLTINSFGFGTCGTQATILAKLLNQFNYPVRLRHLNGHAVPEFFNGIRWVTLDPDKSVFYFNDKYELIGINELKNNPDFIYPESKYTAYDRNINDFPQDSMSNFKEIVINSEGAYLQPVNIKCHDTDWLPLLINLPAKSSFSFPYEGNFIFFAENKDLAVPEMGIFANNVLMPKHKYGILEVEPGTTGKIAVGLYPFKIEGDCTVIIGASKQAIAGKDFDQVNEYRVNRFFADTINLIETKSTVRIYYLLSNYVQLLKSNKLIVRGVNPEDISISVIHNKEKIQNAIEEIPPVNVTSSDESPNYPARNLINGKISKSWIANYSKSSKPIELVFDLGASYDITKMSLMANTEYPYKSPSKFTVYKSQDGKKYIEVFKEIDCKFYKAQWHNISLDSDHARYVKLLITPIPESAPGYFSASLSEVKFYTHEVLDEITPVNVTASDEAPNYPAKKLINGTARESWIANYSKSSKPIELIFDLGKSYNVLKIALMANVEYLYKSPSSFVIYKSLDGKKYTETFKESNCSYSKNQWHNIGLNAGDARYIKLLITPVPESEPGYFSASLSEVKFYYHKD